MSIHNIGFYEDRCDEEISKLSLNHHQIRTLSLLFFSSKVNLSISPIKNYTIIFNTVIELLLQIFKHSKQKLKVYKSGK